MTIAPSMPSLEEGRLWVIYMLKIHLQSLLSLIPSSFPPSLPPSLPLSPSSLPSSLYITGSEEQSILPTRCSGGLQVHLLQTRGSHWTCQLLQNHLMQHPPVPVPNSEEDDRYSNSHCMGKCNTCLVYSGS